MWVLNFATPFLHRRLRVERFKIISRFCTSLNTIQRNKDKVLLRVSSEWEENFHSSFCLLSNIFGKQHYRVHLQAILPLCKPVITASSSQQPFDTSSLMFLHLYFKKHFYLILFKVVEYCPDIMHPMKILTFSSDPLGMRKSLFVLFLWITVRNVHNLWMILTCKSPFWPYFSIGHIKFNDYFHAVFCFLALFS